MISASIFPEEAALTSLYGILDATTPGDRIAALGVAIGLATIIVVILQVVLQIVFSARQIRIANEQIVIAKRQLALAETELEVVKNQGRIMERQDELLNRRAKLVLHSTSPRYSPVKPGTMQTSLRTMRLTLTNVGQKAANSCLITIALAPGTTIVDQELKGVWRARPAIEIDGRNYMVFECKSSVLIYPHVPLQLAPIYVNYRTGDTLAHRWRIVYEDDVTPSIHDWHPLGTKDELPKEWQPK